MPKSPRTRIKRRIRTKTAKKIRTVRRRLTKIAK